MSPPMDSVPLGQMNDADLMLRVRGHDDEAAFALLETAEVVTIPAADGGYVLIGARRFFPELFRDMPWSTPELLAATRYRAQTLDLDYRELPPWEDLDNLAALRRLIERSPHSSTARHALVHLAHHL